MRLNAKLAVVFALAVSALAFAPQPAQAGPWIITKTSWSATDERNFSNFIQALGESRCGTVDACLKSPANPYRATDSASVKFESDCGRFPYLLRAYFAWKNGLPFSVVNGVRPVDGLGTDVRYSPKGNYVTSRRDLLQTSSSRLLDGMSAINTVMNSVFTAVYRFNAELDEPNGLFFDLMPVRVGRDTIKPGTLIYDPNGHVALVYKVEDDGRVRFIDAHPDNSVTRSVYGEKFVRASPGSGSGFKAFRPLILTGATRAANGGYVGGRVTTIPFTSVPGYSMEQFYGTSPTPDKNWRRAIFEVNGQRLGYYDFIRTKLAVGDLRYHPVEEMQNAMETLCSDIKDRVAAVDEAILKNIQTKDQPNRLPENIYGTSGEWESYSTPSRDARLKASFLELRTEVQRFVELYRTGSPRVDYQGTNLAADLLSAYNTAAASCVIQYRRSDSSVVQMNYDHVVQRLWKLSFDPYHCPELRWGASETNELMTCTDGSVKRAWYEAEQNLRNQIDRSYDVRMGFNLQQLQAFVPGSGVAVSPDVDLRGYLYSL